MGSLFVFYAGLRGKTTPSQPPPFCDDAAK